MAVVTPPEATASPSAVAPDATGASTADDWYTKAMASAEAAPRRAGKRLFLYVLITLAVLVAVGVAFAAIAAASTPPISCGGG